VTRSLRPSAKFGRQFLTAINEINHLAQNVDQEVGSWRTTLGEIALPLSFILAWIAVSEFVIPLSTWSSLCSCGLHGFP
jgi:hypothetical protein